jgi:predicted nicotinamide N-methyase
MWPSAVVLSLFLVTDPSLVRGKRVIEIGAGCGLTGLVAARLQKLHISHDDDINNRQTVILTDFNPIVVENLKRNASLNDLADACSATQLDFYQQSGQAKNGWMDMDGHIHEAADVVLAADMICQPDDAVAAANTIHDALVPGGEAFVVCADAAHRFGVDRFASECHRAGLTVSARDVHEMYGGELLEAGLEQTAGYVKGMNLTMFIVGKKP